jgi:hypothetical protein
MRPRHPYMGCYSFRSSGEGDENALPLATREPVSKPVAVARRMTHVIE